MSQQPDVSGVPCRTAIRTGTRCLATISSGRKTGGGRRYATRCASWSAKHKAGKASRRLEPSTLEAYEAPRRSRLLPGVMTQGRRSLGERPSAWSTRSGCWSRWSSWRLRPVTMLVASLLSTVRGRSRRALSKVFCDGGFKTAFKAHCAAHHVSAEVVERIHSGRFEVLPRRWVVERTWSWLINNRRLQVDYERLPVVAEGFVWAAHSRLLLRRLTTADSQ